MTSRHMSVGTLREFAISSVSASTSVSPRCLKIWPARSSPTATRRMAAFWMPLILRRAGLGASSVDTLVLRHPLLDLRGDAIGLALHQLVELVEGDVGLARREGDRRRGRLGGRLLERGQRHRLLDLGQPGRRGERLALAALE